MAVMVHWNGKDVPKELRALPEGRYVIESVDAAPALSPDEETGLEQAIDSLRLPDHEHLGELGTHEGR